MLNTQIIPGGPCHLVIADANHQEEVHHPNATELYEKIFEADDDVSQACSEIVADFFEL